jgi:DNA-binding NarL/FixJ family response regulator
MRAAGVRVLLVDDSEIFLGAAATVITRTPGFDLAGTATSGEAAVALAASLDPDLVLMDHRMSGLSGIEAARRIKEAQPRTVVAIVSADSGSQLENEAFPVLSKQHFTSKRLLELWREIEAA